MSRRYVNLTLLSWYAVLALLGPGMHELLGCHHHNEIVGPVECGQVSAQGLASPSVAGANQACDDDDDCPLCKFLSTVQCAAARNRCVPRGLILLGFAGCFCEAAQVGPYSFGRIRAPPPWARVA